MKRLFAPLVAVISLAAPMGAAAQDVAARLNDYPTEARADYIFGCMATNGQTRTALRQCSCSIDEIASILPYEAYVEAETVLSMRLTGGERMAVFNSAFAANELVAELRRAQAEAEVVCFF
jgi:lysyl-tRNA synthetase class II